MIVLRILGILLAALSALVLAIAFKGLWRAQRSFSAHGINEPIPLDLKARMIVWGWVLGLVAGIALIVLSYSLSTT